MRTKENIGLAVIFKHSSLSRIEASQRPCSERQYEGGGKRINSSNQLQYADVPALDSLNPQKIISYICDYSKKVVGCSLESIKMLTEAKHTNTFLSV